jgi:serine phosphatase RsbU (regulator of sigma subunit)
MFGRVDYSSTELQVEAGSHVVIFTDGLTDAQTPSGEEFGEERGLIVAEASPER